ncbi:hypothetical protein [Methylacidimicrobium sp. AP8]|uniref:hypothetical protein n=1 Tax=Methylacidimicrobium sp. AP8 TaxID=2730359 RepID=UPI001921EE64|nr:hypothetical protein [Methylacidimicrobium sp. AP8]
MLGVHIVALTLLAILFVSVGLTFRTGGTGEASRRRDIHHRRPKAIRQERTPLSGSGAGRILLEVRHPELFATASSTDSRSRRFGLEREPPGGVWSPGRAMDLGYGARETAGGRG